MELHNLKPAPGSTRNNKRVGRGQGTGAAGTAGKGHKGAKSRSGNKLKRGFEGGQTPMQRRLPKRGFKSPNRVEYVGINLDRIQEIIEKYNVAEISPESLQSNRIVGKKDRIKILGRGELKGAVKISAHAVSASAKLAIEGNGGSITLV
ncbi:MAG: 50S ribosomal protein L15 [Lewinellaceae bacterium]|nr:50S ribosomal protein L15 [Saprospiraceae bacterium]MCB9339488.1 50S ribosomal protein L15 [Lewinellaceae bacterium]